MIVNFLLCPCNEKIYGVGLVEAIFTYPIITPTKLASELNMHYTTTSRYLAQLVEIRILTEAVVGKRHLFANHKLLKILSKPSGRVTMPIAESPLA